MESLERQETYVLGKRTILIIQFHLEKNIYKEIYC